MFRKVSPTKMYLPDDLPKAQLEMLLTYRDKKIDFQIQKLKKSNYLLWKLGPDGVKEQIDALKAEQVKVLLWRDEEGMYTYPSFEGKIRQFFNGRLTCETKVEYEFPEEELIPWSTTAKLKKLRPYQEEMVEKLLTQKHAAVEVGTGLGKSVALMNLAKRLGQKTVVMTPSVSIARQIYDEFVENFGARYVGAFFDSKKQSDKKFVISVAASLAKVRANGKKDKHYENLASATVFIADESHTCPAKTLEDVCHGLLADAPYRFFFSGTQLRGDGLDLLLEGITGPIVYRMTVKEGVDQGYLSKPHFQVVRVESRIGTMPSDPNDITRTHLYYNPSVNKAAAKVANKCVSLLNHPVLILVDEFEQFAHLLPHLRHKVAFAHGGVTAQNAGSIPKEYHKCDPNELVRQFNSLEIPILVGTSCISTGTDIRAVKDIIYLMGGKSETQIRQAIGRGTRLFEGKNEFKFWDFDVTNVDLVHRHAMVRASVYDNVYGPVHYMDMEVK
jgi:superfamily II DNA or RNA helicase